MVDSPAEKMDYEKTVARLLPMYRSDRADRPENVLDGWARGERVIEALKLLIDVLLPGRTVLPEPSESDFRSRLTARLQSAAETLLPELARALPLRTEGAGYQVAGAAARRRKAGVPLDTESAVLNEVFRELPSLRAKVVRDIKAAYDGDPAVLSYAEVKVALPGIFAVTAHRIAHEFYNCDVPLIPRMMSEWVHSQTGIDIHPGAVIGSGFFIDHGTGVVVGETAVIGDNVKMYQGAILGAKSFTLDELGNPVKHIKRHPTVEDDVVIYSNAIILGGDTVVGKGSTIGGSVFLTKSVPPNSRVINQPPKLEVKQWTEKGDDVWFI